MSARWLMVGNDLRMTCFVKRRTTGGIEVTVAVREWDDIITSIPESNPRFVINRSTQQHRRASIRQAMLDLKLRNRNADQHELQLLKQRYDVADACLRAAGFTCLTSQPVCLAHAVVFWELVRPVEL